MVKRLQKVAIFSWMAMLRPQVKWTQRKDKIRLKVVQSALVVEQCDIDDTSNKIRFRAHSGDQSFQFEIEFYAPVSAKLVRMDVATREVRVYIPKIDVSASHWPRLTKSSEKLPFLSVDWDLYADEEEEEAQTKSDLDKLLEKSLRRLDAKDARSTQSPIVWFFLIALFVALALLGAYFALSSSTRELFANPDL